MPAELSQLSTRQKAGYYCSNLLLRGLIGAALLVPYKARVPMMGWFVSRILGPLAGGRRRVRANLAMVCPEMPEDEVARMCIAVPDNVGRSLIELYSGQQFIDRVKNSPISGQGLKALEEARAAGRPVILMTRPAPEGADTARDLAARTGCGVVVSPLLAIRAAGDLPDMTRYRSLIFTSRNGVRAYAALNGPKLPAVCVGEATARAARDAGHPDPAQRPGYHDPRGERGPRGAGAPAHGPVVLGPPPLEGVT